MAGFGNQIINWHDSLHGDYLWSNVNFGEAVSEVMTPLTSSVIQFTLDDWVFLPGMPTLGVIGGRPYLNISIFATLFYGMGRSRQDLLDYMESTLYMRLPDEMPIPSIPVSRATLVRSIACALRVQLKQQRAVRKAPAYVENNQAWFRVIRDRIQAQTTGAGLYNLWHREMKPHIKQGVWCVLGSATYSAVYTQQLRRQLAELVGLNDANILIANLSGEDTVLASLGPLLGLQQLARGEISRAAYLEDFGHRGPQEFELSVARPAEDAAWLESELARITRSPVDVAGLMAKQRAAFAAARQRLRAHSPTARRFGRRLAESARRARLREGARSAYSRDRWAVRLFALRAAELSGLGEQVFFLTLRELLACLSSGDCSATQFIGPRVAAYEQYSQLPPYPPVIRGRFDPFAWAASPHRRGDVFDASRAAVTAPDKTEMIAGAPGSAGTVEGTVRIVDRPENGALLQEGEVLVAVQTDIAWTLVFPRAVAVVTDVGAPLSHAAIVARELGIPAVVGCGNATTILKSGDRVCVDGSAGTVTILRRASS